MQESYCYQIFLDQKHNLLLPSVQQLLEHSFHSEAIKLAEVSSGLLVPFDHSRTFWFGTCMFSPAPAAAAGTAGGTPSRCLWQRGVSSARAPQL